MNIKERLAARAAAIARHERPSKSQLALCVDALAEIERLEPLAALAVSQTVDGLRAAFAPAPMKPLEGFDHD